jgi:nucleotide-binding universal stress UspA family protein
VPDEETSPSGPSHCAAVPAGTRGGTIVCVVEDPESADAALDVAKGLAGRFAARMVLVGVSDREESLGTIQLRAGARRRLQRLAVEHGLLDEEQRVVGGDLAEAVARVAAEEAADVIVVGARRGLRTRTLLSLVAGDLAATASCPVVVAPPRRL